MADYSTSTPLTTNTGLVYGVVGVSNTNTPILYDPNSIGSRTLTFTAPTGFSVVGSPLTGTGTISLGFSAGYALPTTAKQTEWDTAYGWGDHAVAGYLDAADIGSTVLAYDANLQGFATALTLPTVDGTAGQTLKTDGAGTVSFADVVTNGQVINGTAFFVTDTKPTTRIGGAALVDGDQWTKPTDNGDSGTAGDWVWRTGVGWVDAGTSTSTQFSDFARTTSFFDSVHTPIPFRNQNQTLIESVDFKFQVDTTVNDASNYWSFTAYMNFGGGSTPLGSFDTQSLTFAAYSTIRFLIFPNTVATCNTVVDALGSRTVDIDGTVTGAPTSIRKLNFVVTTRAIHP